MSVTVLPAVDLQSGHVTLFLHGASHHYFCAQPHQLIDALNRAVRPPAWEHDGVLTVRVATTGRRAPLLPAAPVRIAVHRNRKRR